MTITSLKDLPAGQKEELVASLCCLIAGKASDEIEAAKLQAIATASGNSLSDPLAALFAKVVASAPLKIETYTPGPGGGAAGAAAEEEAEEEVEEEEEEAPIGGGDMFG